MRRIVHYTLVALAVIIAGWNRPLRADISCDTNAPAHYFAGKELRRYLYLTTARLHHLTGSRNPGTGDHFFLEIDKRLATEEYAIGTSGKTSALRVRIAGGSDRALLYGVYHYAEKLGVWFSLSGDDIPFELVESLPRVDLREKPAFAVRGVQLFPDFPEGPDWWGETEYLAYIAQLPKLRLNFLGIHAYGENNPTAEPTVWIGKRGDVGSDGRVKASYPASFHGSLRGKWGYKPMRTSDYHFGAGQLFESDDHKIWSAPTDNDLFDQVGLHLRKNFTLARWLGIKTSVGTDAPLTIPRAVKERHGEGVAREDLYDGLFYRITKDYPIDYYSLWTWEAWTWTNVDSGQIADTVADIKAAERALDKIGRPFQLSVMGWCVGPLQDPLILDREIKAETRIGSLNRNVGLMTVDPIFENLKHTNRWAITWFQDDDGLTMPMLWAGRARMDAAEGYQRKLEGMLGIHWHTKWVSPAANAFARALWDLPYLQERREGAIGGNAFKFKEAVLNSPLPPVHQSQRLNTSGYRINVPSGTYNVTLQFCEMQVNGPDQRVFGIHLQGQTVQERFDLYKEAGRAAALDRTFANIAVTNKELNIRFSPYLGFPCVSGIILSNTTSKFTRKINCGGPQYLDYEADQENYAPVLDFYKQWARAKFGPTESENIATLFGFVDGYLPRIARWITGPGSITPDYEDWAQKRPMYDFIDSLEQIKTQLKEPYAGRLGYWCEVFQYFRNTARLRCLWGAYNGFVGEYKNNGDVRTLQMAVALRRQMAEQIGGIYSNLFGLLSTTGELGTISNWEQNVMPRLWGETGEELAQLMKSPLPDELKLPQQYRGPTRIILPTKPAIAFEGAPVKLKIWILSEKPVETVDLYWKLLGQKGYQKESGLLSNRGVWQVGFPRQGATGDLEYYVKVKVTGETPQYYPPETKARIVGDLIVKRNYTIVTVPNIAFQ